MNDKTEQTQPEKAPEPKAPEPKAETTTPTPTPAKKKKAKAESASPPKFELLQPHKLDTFREAGERIVWEGPPSRHLRPLNEAARKVISEAYGEKHLQAVLPKA